MKKRHLFISAVAAAGIALGAAGSASAAAFPTDGGSKNVMVKRASYIHSVYYNGEDFNGHPVTKCITLPAANTDPVWNSTGVPAPDGSTLNLITFTSSDCSAGYTLSKWFTVPVHDTSLTNFWADMTS
ncbi:hypothetical protein [Streptomyces gilvus]|uniref:hypothetical protein n=1 Tax=Streptomyces gilvus TaxID=2920937 RepID=UPI001F115A78|nr:hypothetical protein [Streptomyces sp. CME 23]MCH5677904.1 hypothetical protein [Streptomyces sp. CME 23]